MCRKTALNESNRQTLSPKTLAATRNWGGWDAIIIADAWNLDPSNFSSF